MKKTAGKMNGSGQKHAIVATRWNDFITERLVEGAISAFEAHGVDSSSVELYYVPGAYEIGPFAKKIAASGRFQAVTCLGTVIRGSTPHFDYVAGQAARLIAQASYDTGLPVIFGVITTDTIEQAIERAGTKSGNKGYEAACAAVELADLYSRI